MMIMVVYWWCIDLENKHLILKESTQGSEQYNDEWIQMSSLSMALHFQEKLLN